MYTLRFILRSKREERGTERKRKRGKKLLMKYLLFDGV
jgi:hypothetical protein